MRPFVIETIGAAKVIRAVERNTATLVHQL